MCCCCCYLVVVIVDSKQKCKPVSHVDNHAEISRWSDSAATVKEKWSYGLNEKLGQITKWIGYDTLLKEIEEP